MVRFEQEKKGLTLGADVVIATPGRLISHLSLGYVDLSKVSFFRVCHVLPGKSP